MNKKIYIDLTCLCDRRWTGIEQFSIKFSSTLSQYFKNLRIINIVLRSSKDKRALPESNYVFLGKNRGRLITDYLLIPFFLLCYRPEYIVFPAFHPSRISWLIKPKKTKIITVIHDVVPWHYSNTMSFFAPLLLHRYKYSLKHSYKILTVSETERNSLLKLNPGATIKCVYNPISNNIMTGNTSILKRLSLSEKKYILSVSTIEPRKNINYTLSILYDFISTRSDLQIVLVGRIGWGKNEISEIIEVFGSKIIYTGYISDDDLSTLYKNALFYISLPIHEGFGRTLIESLLNNTRVVISDIPVFREIIKSGALFLPLNDKKTALEILEENVDNLVKSEIDIEYYKQFTENNYYKLLSNDLF